MHEKLILGHCHLASFFYCFIFIIDAFTYFFTSNSEIIQIASLLLILTIILEPGRSFNMVIINSLRAAGDAKFPVYMAMISMWGIGLPIAYLLGIQLEMGLIGVWISFIVDEWVEASLCIGDGVQGCGRSIGFTST